MPNFSRRGFLCAATSVGALGYTHAAAAFPVEAARPGMAESVLEPDLPIIDCHHHLWDAPFPGLGLTGSYLLPEITHDVMSGHNIRGTVFIEVRSRYRGVGPMPLRPVGETEFANAVAEENARSPQAARRICAGIIAHADLRLGEAVEEVLAAHVEAAPKRFRGIRQSVVPAEQGGSFEDGEHLLRSPAFRAGLKQLAKHDLSFDLMLLHTQLPDAVDTVRATPEVRFVLDHVGVPMGIGKFAGHRDDVFKQWASDLRTLAQEPNVHVKVGGLEMATSGFAWSRGGVPPSSEMLAAALKPYYEHAIECFTPARTMFESNFPPDSVAGSYLTVWNALKRFSSQYSPAERAHMFHDNAVRFYRL